LEERKRQDGRGGAGRSKPHQELMSRTPPSKPKVKSCPQRPVAVQPTFLPAVPTNNVAAGMPEQHAAGLPSAAGECFARKAVVRGRPPTARQGTRAITEAGRCRADGRGPARRHEQGRTPHSTTSTSAAATSTGFRDRGSDVSSRVWLVPRSFTCGGFRLGAVAGSGVAAGRRSAIGRGRGVR
jgi:hypothetical protein